MAQQYCFSMAVGFEHVTRAEKKKRRKNLCCGFFFFSFFFFSFSFVMQPNQKKVLPVVRDSNLRKIFPRMISQVLATLLSVHQTCPLGSSTGAASLLGLNDTDLMNLSSWQLEQKLVLHQLCRASVTAFCFPSFFLFILSGQHCYRLRAPWK